MSDALPEEIWWRISIYASLAHLPWRGILITTWNAGEVISAFRSSEMALMLVDSRAGVQIQTIKLWRDLNRRNKSHAAFVNRLEASNSDSKVESKDIHAKFGTKAASVVIPMGRNDSYKGVIDVLYGAVYFAFPDDTAKKGSIPAEYQGAYSEAGVCLPDLRRKATMICS